MLEPAVEMFGAAILGIPGQFYRGEVDVVDRDHFTLEIGDAVITFERP
jgi:hypothetical protein